MRTLLEGSLDPRWKTRLSPDEALAVLDGVAVQRPVTPEQVQDAVASLFTQDGFTSAAETLRSKVQQVNFPIFGPPHGPAILLKIIRSMVQWVASPH
jgi:hypothetical protein